MTGPTIRMQTVLESTINRDGERAVDDPVRKVAAAAVIHNPYAREWREDLSLLTEWGADLGGRLAETTVDRLGGADQVESYGKGAIVGTDGELEHVAAMLHPKLGTPLREVVGGGDAIIPSAKKHGGPGTVLDVPTHYKDEAYVRTHYDAMPVRIEDVPAADELELIVVVTDGGRPHPRIGGLQIDDLGD